MRAIALFNFNLKMRDRVVGRFAQENQMILLTANRSMKGAVHPIARSLSLLKIPTVVWRSPVFSSTGGIIDARSPLE